MKYINRLVVLLFIFTSFFNQAEVNVAEKGYAIAKKLDTRDLGFQDSSSELSMILKDTNGAESVRDLNVQTLENPNGGNKTLIKFTFPVDIQGTALLTHPKNAENDEQWLFLPVVKRVKRISSRNKSGAFMGSEFSFEDMTSKSIDDFNYRYITTEDCASNRRCDVLERIPKDKHSGYSKQVIWVDLADTIVHKIEFYDRKKALYKVLTASDFKLYENKYWRAHNVEMVNVQTGKETTLAYKSFSFTTGLADSDFHRSVLQR